MQFLPKSARLKKCREWAIFWSNVWSSKFYRLVLGLVGLIDAKGIDVVQCIWLEAVRYKLKNSQKTQKMHF